MMGVYEHHHSTRENNYRNSKVIAFVINAGVNIITNNFDI